MHAIEASTAKISTLVDGTMRLTLDIEPRFAPSAFLAFCTPGTPVAVAVLQRPDQEQAE